MMVVGLNSCYMLCLNIFEHLFIIIVIGVDIILDIYHFSGLHKKKTQHHRIVISSYMNWLVVTLIVTMV